jgi:hypothetical protein
VFSCLFLEPPHVLVAKKQLWSHLLTTPPIPVPSISHL